MSAAGALLGPDEMGELIGAARGMRVAVVGDLCLDAYLVVDATAAERSRETGLSTEPIAEQRYTLGGAGNVAANLASLQLGVSVFGVIGDDPFGHHLRRALDAASITAAGVVVQDHAWDTCAYLKLLAGPPHKRREARRLDCGCFNRLGAPVARELLTKLELALADCDAVVINQQVASGVHTAPFRRGLAAVIARSPASLWLSDTRDAATRYPGTIQKLSADQLSGSGSEDDRGDAIAAGAASLSAGAAQPLFVTLGERGSLACYQGEVVAVPAYSVVGPTDPVGAGDAFVAGLAIALIAGKQPQVAAAFGNAVAAVTVSKLHRTGTADADELLALRR